ncbi:MAG: hypothetical protein ACE5HZ_04905 [Fidelibacterota bacterium]
MRILSTSVVVLFVLSGLSIKAQEMTVPQPEGPTPLWVRFSIHLELDQDEESMLGLPVDLFQRVAEEASLRDFHVHDVRRGYRSRITFEFPTMEAFNAWYGSPSTEILLRTLEDRSTAMEVNLAAGKKGMPPHMHDRMKGHGPGMKE